MPVINVEDGSVLTGDDAPPKRDLERWLHEHPGFMISPQPTSFMNFPIPGLIPEEHTSPSTDLQSVSCFQDLEFYFCLCIPWYCGGKAMNKMLHFLLTSADLSSLFPTIPFHLLYE